MECLISALYLSTDLLWSRKLFLGMSVDPPTELRTYLPVETNGVDELDITPESFRWSQFNIYMKWHKRCIKPLRYVPHSTQNKQHRTPWQSSRRTRSSQHAQAQEVLKTPGVTLTVYFWSIFEKIENRIDKYENIHTIIFSE